MTGDLIIASANLEHWIKAGGKMIGGATRTPQDFDAKLSWAKHLFGATRPHIIGLQEIYDDSISQVFSGLGNYTFHFSGGADQQVALATTLKLAEDVTTLQILQPPLNLTRDGMSISVSKLSRPILRARLLHEGETLTVFVVHLKSKIPSYGDESNVTYAEEDLATADFGKRPLGSLVSLVRRAAEASVLRAQIVDEMTRFPNRPIVVCGDLNDDTGAVTTEMILGDSMRTFIKNRPPAGEKLDAIYSRLHQYLLTSTQDAHIRASALSEFPTAVHEGRYSTLDHVFLSRHFFPKPRVVAATFEQKYFFNYYEVANDHLVDDASEFSPRKPATSDHGIVTVYCRKKTGSSLSRLHQPADLMGI